MTACFVRAVECSQHKHLAVENMKEHLGREKLRGRWWKVMNQTSILILKHIV